MIVGALVSDLRTSDGTLHAQQALKKADEYLGRETEGRVVHNRTVINTGTTINSKTEKETGDESIPNMFIDDIPHRMI